MVCPDRRTAYACGLRAPSTDSRRDDRSLSACARAQISQRIPSRHRWSTESGIGVSRGGGCHLGRSCVAGVYILCTGPSAGPCSQCLLQRRQHIRHILGRRGSPSLADYRTLGGGSTTALLHRGLYTCRRDKPGDWRSAFDGGHETAPQHDYPACRTAALVVGGFDWALAMDGSNRGCSPADNGGFQLGPDAYRSVSRQSIQSVFTESELCIRSTLFSWPARIDQVSLSGCRNNSLEHRRPYGDRLAGGSQAGAYHGGSLDSWLRGGEDICGGGFHRGSWGVLALVCDDSQGMATDIVLLGLVSDLHRHHLFQHAGRWYGFDFGHSPVRFHHGRQHIGSSQNRSAALYRTLGHLDLAGSSRRAGDSYWTARASTGRSMAVKKSRHHLCSYRTLPLDVPDGCSRLCRVGRSRWG